MFDEDSSFFFRLVVLSLFSIILMSVDHRTQYLGQVRGFLSIFVYPLQSLASLPQTTIGWLNQSVSSQQSLLDENKGIRKENLLLKAQLQQFTALQSENMRLRSLLLSSRKLSDDMLIAETISVNMDPYQRKIVINKGSSQGVYKGQPIVDAYGVMGQINEPGLLSSTAILITDPSHAIPVQVNRNGLRAVVYGTGAADILLIPYLPNNSDIKVGDVLVSSGLGGRFPEGYPVAIVESVSRNLGQPFADIKAKPEAHLERSREVLLVLKSEPPVAIAENILPETNLTEVITETTKAAT
ncbi:MAG: rod shape-determining protein MreC, partial [Pseudomonadota bacterium]